jgi:acetate kinase
LESLGPSAGIDVVGHRIVNGGKSFSQPERITPQVKSALAELAQAAPQHNQLEMAGIAAVEKVFGPKLSQVAVFDSAFHSTLPPAAYVYPGPAAWLEEGIRRFGFHGISHRYVSRRAAHMLNRPVEDLKLITCHLGNGCSLAAVSGGRSIDTTMGFTPLEGLMMGTRSGSIDPGIIVYLMRRHGYSADDIDRILNRESGLKGLSGSGEMREVVCAGDGGDEHARLALDVFVHRLSAGIGAMLASLGGLDALIFTGGIGENVPLVRERACRQFEFLGVHIDPALNAQGPERDIATAESTRRVLIIRTEEDWEIARDCWRVLMA